MVALTFALASRSNETASVWPCRAAHTSADAPSIADIFMQLTATLTSVPSLPSTSVRGTYVSVFQVQHLGNDNSCHGPFGPKSAFPILGFSLLILFTLHNNCLRFANPAEAPGSLEAWRLGGWRLGASGILQRRLREVLGRHV